MLFDVHGEAVGEGAGAELGDGGAVTEVAETVDGEAREAAPEGLVHIEVLAVAAQ
jgi:hypothetical protein